MTHAAALIDKTSACKPNTGTGPAPRRSRRLGHSHRPLWAARLLDLVGVIGLIGLQGMTPASAEDLQGVQAILSNSETSPIPAGWWVGAAGYTGSSPYRDGNNTSTPIPGALYIGSDFMYLGDRAFYTFAHAGPVSFFGRARVRLGNLDPKDQSQWTLLKPRRWQGEAGLGATWLSGVGLWTARVSTDVTQRTGGSEVLFSWSAPVVQQGWMVMPGLAAIWRQDKLANYYFGGVSAAEASTALPAYNVGHAWSISPSVLSTYRINPQWMVGGLFSMDIFSNAIKDSPLVQQRSRYDLLLGLAYIWR
ncbi:MipA/OmpV family protein [Roseateles koreensis]|uniref:MipA/OmpV family protein n=1 Tax=Roseateles koreensis TaxID=2987526 RepID=A0ABT5KP68_9BURK|nr:MipA/OmpV family protein [Roseateles koreensis]MDC8784708.1 MipA/OmpV family protein [Roseateles koreensis]